MGEEKGQNEENVANESANADGRNGQEKTGMASSSGNDKAGDGRRNVKAGAGEEDEGEEQGPGWRRFKQWVHCFCVVTFDLELGQTIEVVYPGNAQLSQSERSDLCYLAFPDSNSSSSFSSSPALLSGRGNSRRVVEGSATDSAHHFRLRRTSFESIDKFPDPIAQQLLPPLRPDSRFLYGFAHFRRKRDSSVHRGYSQKSMVLLTHLPFVALFSRVLNEVAMAFFAGGEIAIETACRQIGQYWPAPLAGGDRLLCLPLFGLRFCCSIPADPNANAEAQPAGDGDFGTMQMAAGPAFPRRQSLEEEEGEGEEFEVVDYLHCSIVHLQSVSDESDRHFHAGIKRVLHHLHLLWELVLLGEPLLILAPSPGMSSSLVHALVSTICPLRYIGDFRPYFTIHDSDFNEMGSRQNCQANSCILGVTNPFFLKALAHWPHILKINVAPPHLRRERSESRLVRQLRAQPAAQFVLGGLKRSGTASDHLGPPSAWADGPEREEEEAGGEKMIKRLWDRAQLEHRASGFLCGHKQFLAQDKTLARRLLRTPSDSGSQWSALRWHFGELTQSFMSPLESFISTLLPLRRELSPFQAVPQMRPFSLDQFLGSLRHFGHPGVKGDWQGLYRQFVTRSPNFLGWLRQRQADIERQLRLEHMEVISRAQFTATTLRAHDQVEIVDLVLKLTNRLAELDERQKAMGRNSSSSSSSSRNTNWPIKEHLGKQRASLQQQLGQILASVEEDLKMVLLSNPAFQKAAEEDTKRQLA